MSCKPLTTRPKLHYGTPLLDEAFIACHEPEVGETWDGEKRILSPDTPYAAAVARNALYFIDTRLNAESAQCTKAQLEGLIPDGNGYWFIDEVDATAERRDVSGKTVFTFNPAYARVLFADSMNRRNPNLRLPVHEPAGEWLVSYDIGNAVVGGRAKRVGRGLRLRDGVMGGRSGVEERGERGDGRDKIDDDNCRDGGLVDADGRRAAAGTVSKAAVDTPRFEGETDAEYYQRMDKLHWH